MPMSFLGLPLLMFVSGVGLLILANLMFYVILGEVNGKDPSNQVSLWFVNIRSSAVLRRHAEFFPRSRKRAQMKWIAVVGFVLILAAVLIGAARHSKLQ